MKVFKTKLFAKWAVSAGLQDAALVQTIDELNRGLCEANLGAGLYKKRVSLTGRGKNGGARTLIAFKSEHAAFFVYGFQKNKKANISPEELLVYKELAKLFLGFSQKELELAAKSGVIQEVKENE